MLDTVVLLGTSLQGSEDFEMTCLSATFLMMATGDTTDNGFKQEKRAMLINVKSTDELAWRKAQRPRISSGRSLAMSR
jgi:hypothetical protein